MMLAFLLTLLYYKGAKVICQWNETENFIFFKNGGVIMTNAEIRSTAKKAGVRQWQIAEKLGISEFTLIRRMRHDLTQEQQKEILNAIIDIAEEAKK